MELFIGVIVIRDIGGISRSIINLMKNIHSEYNITLCVLEDFISPNVHIPGNVKIIRGSKLIQDGFIDRNSLKSDTFLARARRTVNRINRRLVGPQKYISSAIEKMKIEGEYDVAIAFSNDLYNHKGELVAGGVNELVLKKVKAQKRVAWIHNDPRECGFTRDICRRDFNDFDVVVNVSYDCKKIFDDLVPEFKWKSMVAYNLYDISKIKNGAMQTPYCDNGKLHFVTVARLYNHQKRIDRIIETINILNQKGKANRFDWVIVGEGPDKDMLQMMIEKYKLDAVVKLAGLQINPYPFMKYANAFILPSAYEGYGMTIKEAQILSTPTLVTNFGPAKEAVEDGKTGLICDNTDDDFTRMIEKIVDNPMILKALRDYLVANPITNEVGMQQFRDIVKVE